MSHLVKTATIALGLALSFSASAENKTYSIPESYNDSSWMDEFDPSSPEAEALLEAYDLYYKEMTGEDAKTGEESLFDLIGGCYRYSCKVFLYINIAEQRGYLHVDGNLVLTAKVSSAAKGYKTRRWDNHPSAPLRAYKGYYMSGKYPGGNYVTPEGKKMGNMPYAVFYSGGFAVHGTPQGNWSKLGRPASHGCIRMHPDNANYFSQLVRAAGRTQTWMTVE